MPRGVMAGPVGACPAPWGRDRHRWGLADPVGEWPAPWGPGRPRGGLANPVVS